MIDGLSCTVSTRYSTKSQIYKLHKHTNTQIQKIPLIMCTPAKQPVLIHPVIFIFTVRIIALLTDCWGKSMHYDMSHNGHSLFDSWSKITLLQQPKRKGILIHNDQTLFVSWKNLCVFYTAILRLCFEFAHYAYKHAGRYTLFKIFRFKNFNFCFAPFPENYRQNFRI